jgi:hypothetical protein
MASVKSKRTVISSFLPVLIVEGNVRHSREFDNTT